MENRTTMHFNEQIDLTVNISNPWKRYTSWHFGETELTLCLQKMYVNENNKPIGENEKHMHKIKNI